MDFVEADLMTLRTFINYLPLKYIFYFRSPHKYCGFCIIVCISFHMLEPKTNYQLFRLIIGPKANYQLFKLIIGFGYKEAIATMAGSHDHAMLNLNIL